MKKVLLTLSLISGLVASSVVVAQTQTQTASQAAKCEAGYACGTPSTTSTPPATTTTSTSTTTTTQVASALVTLKKSGVKAVIFDKKVDAIKFAIKAGIKSAMVSHVEASGTYMVALSTSSVAELDPV